MFIKETPKNKKPEKIENNTTTPKKQHGARVKKKNEMDEEEYAKVCERMAMLRDARKKKLNEISTNPRPHKEVIKYVDRPVEVIKEIEKPVEVIKEVIKEVEKPVEKIIYKKQEKDPFEEEDYKHVKNELSEMKKMMAEMRESIMPKQKEQQQFKTSGNKIIYRPFGGFTPY